ncbi:MAG: hypothetical protein LBL46_03490 [Rickettsiales bacterium]|jgi:hypothetical protein|nr:hypothetical protein [Rickettsiales bacterium]
MPNNRGNFMLQALLALSLVIGFLPVFVKKIEDGGEARVDAATAAQITGAWDAARAFLFEEADNLPIGIKVFSGDALIDNLEPFGLPLGFIPKTPLNHEISLIVAKDGPNILAFLRAAEPKRKLPVMRRADILSQIGFWGAVVEGDKILGETGGWEAAIPRGLDMSPDDIWVRVPEDEEFSELVARKAKNPLKNVFHTDLKMDDNNVSAGKITAGAAEIKVVSAGDFRLSGIEADRKNKNEIGGVRAGKVWFSDAAGGNPLNITRSDLTTGRFSANGVGNYGDIPALTAGRIAVRDFNMTAGRTSFAGPANWDIRNGASTTNITISVEKLDIGAYLDASRGQDVFLNAEGTDLEYTAGTGIRVDKILADNIVLRDMTSSELLGGGSGGASVLEIRPAGTSVLPDALVGTIANDALKIPINAADNNGKLESCKSVIEKLGGKYSAQSLTDNIVCRFVLLNRIEHRIEIKKCIDAGGSKCY